MNTLHLTDQQLFLVERALDFYSRIGIGQFDRIKDHPTFEAHLHREFALKTGPFEVGDKTVRGEVVEIGPKGKWIKTKGSWGNGEEIRKWTDVENIQHSTDYSRYHAVRDAVDMALVQPRNMLYNNQEIGKNGSWGIHHPSVDDSCRMAFDIHQVIRHERWKRNENRSSMTVDSHIHFTHQKDGSSNLIKCEMEEPVKPKKEKEDAGF
jgi:hypothetical protein